MALADLLYSAPSQSAIGAMTLDVLLEEKVSLPSLATEYPVETGGTITDDVIPQSRRLSISGSIATGSTMMFSALLGGTPTGKGKLQDAKAVLESIWDARTPITIVTGLDVYSDFAMTECEMTRTGDGAATWLDIRASFIEIRTVSTQTTTVAADPVTQQKVSPSKVKAGNVTGSTPNSQTATKAQTVQANSSAPYSSVANSGLKSLGWFK